METLKNTFWISAVDIIQWYNMISHAISFMAPNKRSHSAVQAITITLYSPTKRNTILFRNRHWWTFEEISESFNSRFSSSLIHRYRRVIAGSASTMVISTFRVLSLLYPFNLDWFICTCLYCGFSFHSRVTSACYIHTFSFTNPMFSIVK